ncbi:hypothetical protein [Streptomyces sp. NPDC021224]|uniref:hypothetical protein n=1 Tax=unclassified Streptomyces TaxID=2593676 RepID=UPI003795C6B4
MTKKRLALAVSTAAAVALVLPAAASAQAQTGADRSPLQAYAIKVVETSHTLVKNDKGETTSVNATPASVFFTPQSPSYAGDSQYSHFTGQVAYGSSSLTFAWSDRLHANVYALATGPMTETATATANGKATGYKDTHIGVPASYLAHSSFAVSTKAYVLTINENFPVAGGTEYITTQFAFTVTLI